MGKKGDRRRTACERAGHGSEVSWARRVERTSFCPSRTGGREGEEVRAAGGEGAPSRNRALARSPTPSTFLLAHLPLPVLLLLDDVDQDRVHLGQRRVQQLGPGHVLAGRVGREAGVLVRVGVDGGARTSGRVGGRLGGEGGTLERGWEREGREACVSVV